MSGRGGPGNMNDNEQATCWMCVCGHPESHHDAGECWTDADGNETYGETACPCSWLEIVTVPYGTNGEAPADG